MQSLTVVHMCNGCEASLTPVLGFGFLLLVFVSSLLGIAVGFCAGLVPGLHMNNIAAAISVYSASVLSLFAALDKALAPYQAGLLVCCFISAALMAHSFAQAITSTYVGVPAGDVVSVLPAHRLAKAGLGGTAVKASVEGSLAGVLASTVVLLPICWLMGHPVHAYDVFSGVMGFVTLSFSGLLLLSEGFPSIHPRLRDRKAWASVARAMALFSAAGILGLVVFRTDYFACSIPDVPWIRTSFVPRSSLLLPLFAGLFGVPSLILSLGLRRSCKIRLGSDGQAAVGGRLRELVLSVFGGCIVGWLPGMTPGASATVCSPAVREVQSRTDVEGSVRFIWLYSSISASGAVFALGALFVISRARSGSMDAISFFLQGQQDTGGSLQASLPLLAILLSMVFSASISRQLVLWLNSRLARMSRLLGSRELALVSLAFVCSLSLALTGTRGALLLLTSATLGLLPPMAGARRIQLMGSLLVPITLMFFLGA